MGFPLMFGGESKWTIRFRYMKDGEFKNETFYFSGRIIIDAFNAWISHCLNCGYDMFQAEYVDEEPIK